MTYKLEFHPKAAKDKLKGHQEVYKIKLRSAGVRLAYRVLDNRLVIFVIVVGKRENNEIYYSLDKRKN